MLLQKKTPYSVNGLEHPLCWQCICYAYWDISIFLWNNSFLGHVFNSSLRELYSFLICVFMCVHINLCTHVYVWIWTHVCASVCEVSVRKWLEVSFSRALNVICWDSLSLNLELWMQRARLPSAPRNLPLSLSPCTKVTDRKLHVGFLCGCWGAELGSSCFHTSHFVFQKSYLFRPWGNRIMIQDFNTAVWVAAVWP